MEKKYVVFDMEKEIQLQHIEDLGNYNSMCGDDTDAKH